jgi:hypothetical protein
MARGRKTSFTIHLTPAQRQTLLAWQRATAIPTSGYSGLYRRDWKGCKRNQDGGAGLSRASMTGQRSSRSPSESARIVAAFH